MSGPSAAGSPGDGALCDEDPLEEDQDALDFDVAQHQQDANDDMLEALHDALIDQVREDYGDGVETGSGLHGSGGEVPLEGSGAVSLGGLNVETHVDTAGGLHVVDSDDEPLVALLPPLPPPFDPPPAGLPSGSANEEVPPPPPQPYSAVTLTVGFKRQKPTASVRLGCGTVSYYRSTESFEAECKLDDHTAGHRCRVSRTSRASPLAHRSGQGRPLGMLACFLLTRVPHDADGSLHTSYWERLITFSQVERLQARQAIRDAAGGLQLLACERAARDGEGEEPDMVP